jgi:hypothetical protein
VNNSSRGQREGQIGRHHRHQMTRVAGVVGIGGDAFLEDELATDRNLESSFNLDIHEVVDLIGPHKRLLLPQLALISRKYIRSDRMAESTEDPLVLLRSSIASSSNPPVLTDSSGQPTTQALDATNVALSSSSGSSTTLPITTPTRLTSQANDASNLLTLQQLLYTYLEKDSGNADYMRKAAAGVGAGFRPVGILDRRIVLEYLVGGEAPAGRVLMLGSKPEDKRESFWYPSSTFE